MFPFWVNAVFAGNPYATYLQENEDGSHVLSGVVSDESGNPLPGVSVVVVGTSLGTITDYDGKYTLNLPHTPCRVRYSFIGLEPQEVTVNNTVKVQHMTLKTDAQLLEDVVVIGYGNKNRKSLTSSIVSVKKEDMEKLSHTSTTVQNMLGGTIKGVLVTQNSGEPGGYVVDQCARGDFSLSHYDFADGQQCAAVCDRRGPDVCGRECAEPAAECLAGRYRKH